MPQSEGFDSFARRYAGELLALARCLTIDPGESEQLVEDALLRVWRAEESATSDDDSRLRTGRRAVVRSHLRRRPRASLSMSGGTFELTDRHPSAGEDRPGHGPRPDSLEQALQDLPPRSLVVLALRVGRDLSQGETGGVLGWGSVAVRLMERRALHQVRLVADLGDDPGRNNPAGSEAELWAGLREAFAARVPPRPDTASLLQRVAQRTAGVRRLAPRHRVAVTVTAALALMAAAAGIAAVQQGQPPPAEDRVAAPLRVPAGSRLVGYRSIAVAVPSGWQLEGSSCGRIIVHRAFYRRSSDIGPCASVGPASVTLGDAPLNFPPLVVPRSRTSRVAGHLAQRSAVDRIRGSYSQTVFVFGAHFMMTVRSLNKATVNAVVSSMHPVPKGFTVVPNCESLPVREAVATLEMVGLGSSIAHSLTLSTWHDEPPVIFQSKPSGSIVRRGTAVALTIPGR
jgi:DNA-directed RNA polymerase specialized sigma24 family protein